MAKKKYMPSPNGESWRKVELLDAATLIFLVHKAAATKGVGYEHSNVTLDRLTKRFQKNDFVWLHTENVEAGLWSANLLDEKGKFWAPRGDSFDDFSKRFLKPGERFDKSYCWITGEK